jgi:hypothetical protein
MALMSDPIPVADETPASFKFENFRASVNVQVRFYTTLAAEPADQLSPRGTGSRDITATNVSSAFSGGTISPTSVLRGFTSDINGGALVAAADGSWYELGLGGGMGQVTLTSAAVVTPGTALSYRLIVDAIGASSTGT